MRVKTIDFTRIQIALESVLKLIYCVQRAKMIK